MTTQGGLKSGLMGDPVLPFVALIRQGEHNGPQKEGKKMHGTWWGGPAIPRLVLPDYPETKGKLAKAYFKYFQFLQRQHSGPIGCVGSRRFVEPDRVVLHRADGSVSELSQKEIKAETTVDLK